LEYSFAALAGPTPVSAYAKEIYAALQKINLFSAAQQYF
jgi:hypothetical protein